MGNDNKILFGAQAKEYAKGRPTYPRALFQFLADRCANHNSALDCATGSGQAVFGLAPVFRSVAAFDISDKQLAAAKAEAAHRQLDNVEYFQSTAEAIARPDSSVDLITVAEAAHWLDLEKFYGEANRTLNPTGAIAMWSYYLPTISQTVDAEVNRYYEETLAAYDDPRRAPIKNGCKDLPFPFADVERRVFQTSHTWDFDMLLTNLSSSSLTQKCIRETGVNPLEQAEPALRKAWGGAKERTATWDVHLMFGRKHPAAAPARRLG